MVSTDPAGLCGRTALVTGGASGIGLATARSLAAAGARVAVADLAAGAIDGLAVYPVDVVDETSVENMLAAVSRDLGSPDIVVCSAGIAIRDAATDLAVADWRRVIDVNTTGSFLVARAAARRMTASGAIVFVGSIMGLSGGGIYPNISYQTSKGAIVNMTRALAIEWASRGIRVNSVAPTYVRTPFIAPLLADADIMARIAEMTPMRRLAEPEDVAAAILFLAGPGAAMVTGHTLPVDGGFLAQ